MVNFEMFYQLDGYFEYLKNSKKVLNYPYLMRKIKEYETLIEEAEENFKKDLHMKAKIERERQGRSEKFFRKINLPNNSYVDLIYDIRKANELSGNYISNEVSIQGLISELTVHTPLEILNPSYFEHSQKNGNPILLIRDKLQLKEDFIVIDGNHRLVSKYIFDDNGKIKIITLDNNIEFLTDDIFSTLYKVIYNLSRLFHYCEIKSEEEINALLMN